MQCSTMAPLTSAYHTKIAAAAKHLEEGEDSMAARAGSGDGCARLDRAWVIRPFLHSRSTMALPLRELQMAICALRSAEHSRR